MKAGIGSWVLGVVATLSIAPGRGLAADTGVTWAAVPTPQRPDELTMEARGVWTQSGTLHGYDGKVLLKLAGARVTVGEAKKPTTQIGCFPVPAAQ